tara:strand:+ start:1196 stop:1420 length:225 start_codon:yes stop_codon:yes gene_type:complete
LQVLTTELVVRKLRATLLEIHHETIYNHERKDNICGVKIRKSNEINLKKMEHMDRGHKAECVSARRLDGRIILT